MSIYRIRVRRDTEIRWSDTNPVLGVGEVGFETDTRKLKIGDGSTPWNTLQYINSEAAAHNQDISTINGLQAALDGKANSSHTHAISDVTNLQTTLDGKTDVGHTHYISDVTNLQTTLNNKAALVHTHSISDVTLLQGTLDTKSNIGHTHYYYEVEQDFHFQSTPPSGMVVGSRWMDSNTGIEYTYINDGDSYQWVQSPASSRFGTGYQNTKVVASSGYTVVDSDYYIGVNYSGIVNVYIPSDVPDGRVLIIKDESGYAGYANRYITISGAAVSGLIDNANTAVININNAAIQMIYRGGWRII